MSNRTFEERLAREHPAEPLEGHNVVVFQRVGVSGEKFRTILPPGTPLKRGLRERIWPQGRFFAVAVDASPDLHLDVGQHVVLEDEEAHRFDLLLDLYYWVSDPRLLASHRNRDPLGLVAERARQVVSREVRQLQWTEIVFGFAVCAQEVVRLRLPELKAFAAAYGIALRSLEMGRLLPEEATRGARQTEADLDQVSRGERVGMARMESARRMGDAENLHTLGAADMDAAAQDVRHGARLRAAEVDVRIDAMKQVGAGASTPDDFRAVFHGALQPGPPRFTAPGALPGLHADGAAAPSPAARGLMALLQQVVAATQNVSGWGRRLELRSALLHLLAEVLLEDLGEPAVRARYAESARRLLASLDCLVPHELEALHALSDPVELEKSLRG